MSEKIKGDAGGEVATTPVVVKKYANRRLYNTESSSYITLDNLAELIRKGRDFVVYDAKSGEDITRSVLTQIIVEEEGKGRSLLPTTFLRQLIGFYGDQMQGLLLWFLEQSMAVFITAAGADARGDAEDDGQLLPVQQRGAGGSGAAEHGDGGARDELVQSLLPRVERERDSGGRAGGGGGTVAHGKMRSYASNWRMLRR